MIGSRQIIKVLLPIVSVTSWLILLFLSLGQLHGVIESHPAMKKYNDAPRQFPVESVETRGRVGDYMTHYIKQGQQHNK